MTSQSPSIAGLTLTPYDAAFNNLRSDHSRWNLAKERLQPEAWPVLQPSFKFEAGATIFSTGSCFARNIEDVLVSLGFKVPTATSIQTPEEMNDGVGSNIYNKYTPPGIAQEIRWAAEIFKRDDSPRPEDFEIYAYELPDGRIIDNNLMGFGPVSRERFIERRQALYGIVKSAFSADVAIITPGLVEAWYDAARNIFIQQAFMRRLPEITQNLHFARLNFAQCFAYLDQAVADIRELNPRCKFLITTSPIPLGATFSQDDVIVANARAKATLRAACGELVDKWSDADYFPSFETVTYTRDWSIFLNDLLHVEPSFIARIISRVVGAYCQTQVTSAEHVREAFDSTDEAIAIAAAAKAASDDSSNPLFKTRHVELLESSGRIAEAIETGLKYLSSGNVDRALIRRNIALAMKIAEDGRYAEALANLEAILRVVPENAECRWRVALMLNKLERPEEALAELQKVVPAMAAVNAPFLHMAALNLIVTLRGLGRVDEAIASATSLLEKDPNMARLYVQLAQAQRQKGDIEAAILTLRRCLELFPGHEVAPTLLKQLNQARRSKAARAGQRHQS